MKPIKTILRRSISLLLAAAVVLPGAMPSCAFAANEQSSQVQSVLAGKSAPYDLLIYFKSDASSALSLQQKADKAQARARAILSDAGDDVISWESFYITNAIHVQIASKDLISRLAKLDEVEQITWNGTVECIEPVEDTGEDENSIKMFANTIYQPDERDIEWGVQQVHADKVWDEFGVDGSGATVGIIDGGANFNVPALKNAYNGQFKDFVDGYDTPQHTSSDDHGTHVAGTIVGREGDKLNRIGVAPGAKFITARAMSKDGGLESDLIAAAEWMLQQKPDVINNSWGGNNDDSPWFQAVVKAWTDAGIIPVFAAGNTSGEVPGAGTISNPANYANVLAVAAVDRDKEIGNFSNKGPSAFENAGQKPELSAPGVQVRSVDSNGNYVSWNGTSMAAPHVTGVVALVRAAAKKYNCTEKVDTLEEVRKLLEETAEPLTDSTYTESPNIAYGYGLVNAYDAIAKLAGRDSVMLTGEVLQDGEDADTPTAAFDMQDEGYLGRNVQVNVKLADSVSIRSAELTYTVEGAAPKAVAMSLLSGRQNDGVYSYTIPSAELAKGTLKLSVKATDFGRHEITIDKSIRILPGMTLPWTQDFENADNGLPGFLMDGLWGLSKRSSSKEPELPGEGNAAYIGINPGYGWFERRVDSNLYLPPIDMSNVSADDHPSLNADMFNGFTGLCLAKVQASTTGGGEDSWEDLYDVILRPDITERDWTHCTFSLEKYAGLKTPLQLRFYFFGHDADPDDGAGWYLDNLSVVTNEKTAPGQVQSLQAQVSGKGLNLHFDANEETDMAEYILERKTGDGAFTQLAKIRQDYDAFQFINKGEESARPQSHYHVNYLDTSAQNDQTYTYRVKAVDFTGNAGAYSKELTLTYTVPEHLVKYDFDENNGGFTHMAITGSVDDWTHGTPTVPADLAEKELLMRDAWEGLGKNLTGQWGVTLNDRPTNAQDSALQIPEIEVRSGDYLYFDSYCGVKSASDKVGYTVEIKEAAGELWQPLVSRETVMNDDQTFAWRQIGTSLAKYAGKTVNIRFRAEIGDTVYLSAYNLGWHIDNVMIGSEQKDYQASSEEMQTAGSLKGKARQAMGLDLTDSLTGYHDQMAVVRAAVVTDGTSDNSSGIPFRAKVTVESSDRSTESSEIDGTYSITQAASKDSSYTLRFEAYGYQTQTRTVNGTGTVQVPTVYMKPAAKSSIRGTVTDSSGTALDGVRIRLVDDDKAPILTTGADGVYTGSDVYAGTHTARFYKSGYMAVEQKITLNEGENTIPAVKLTAISGMENAVTDYGITEPTDNYQTIQFTSGPKGMAVRFQSPYVGGMLKSADIFFVQNQYYSGDHVQVGVLTYNDTGRLIELVPFEDYRVAKPNAWNTVDFSEYAIKTDKPIYVAVTYAKDKTDFNQCLGVYYDTKASEKAVERSFIYDGAFTAASTISPSGGYAAKANWMYPTGAKKNPETDAPNGSGSGEQPPIIDDENAFVFDEATQTITGYRGSRTDVVIPAEINGVAVKRIGKGAFDGTGKSSGKLTSVVIPEGVEEIGEEAFKVNSLIGITLPSTLKTIGKGAFKYQFSSTENKGLTLTIPAGVTEIAEEVFQGVGSPLRVTMPGVARIGKNAFDSIRDVEVYADNISEIADEAFGIRNSYEFPYAKVFTREDTKLASVDHQHLINPATITLTEVNIRDSEDILGRNTLYAPNQTRMTRDLPAASFYQIGKTVIVTPPDIRSNGISYMSVDAAATLKLKSENALTFRYDTVAPHLRTPILDTDKEILGFALPGITVTSEMNGKTYTAVANEDGYFSLPVDQLVENDTITLKINGKNAGSQTVTKNSGSEYIVEGTKIVRYLGKGGALTLPVSGSSGKITEIAPFAFAGADLTSVILPDSVETIGIGAFMNTGLQSFGWNLNDINNAKLRSIDEYAFRGNEITEVALPELTHRVRTGAFENNAITALQLGRYTSHVGTRAFKNNKIGKAVLADTAEEIGEEAFMNNEITELTVKDRLPGYEDGLEEIPANAFANNRMSEASLPKTVTAVDETAFAGNTSGRFVIVTDAPEIVPTAGYDVRRSNGTLLKWKDSGSNPGGSAGGGGGSAGGSTNTKPTDNGNSGNNGNTTKPKHFDDVRTGAWYAEAVKYAYNKGLMSGTSANTFSPNASTTRGMLMTVLARYAGEDTAGGATWYEKGMNWAKAKGVSDGTNPTVNITREQLVTMLYRYAGSPAANGSLDSFSDAASVNSYAANAMRWAVANGIVNGSNGKLNPQNNATRAQVAAILMRFCEMSK